MAVLLKLDAISTPSLNLPATPTKLYQSFFARTIPLAAQAKYLSENFFSSACYIHPRSTLKTKRYQAICRLSFPTRTCVVEIFYRKSDLFVKVIFRIELGFIQY